MRLNFYMTNLINKMKNSFDTVGFNDKDVNAGKYKALYKACNDFLEASAKYNDEDFMDNGLPVSLDDKEKFIILNSKVAELAGEIKNLDENNEISATFKDYAKKLYNIALVNIILFSQMDKPMLFSEHIKNCEIKHFADKDTEYIKVENDLKTLMILGDDNKPISKNTFMPEQYFSVDDRVRDLNRTYRYGYENFSGYFNKLINEKHYSTVNPDLVQFRNGTFDFGKYLDGLENAGKKFSREIKEKGLKGPKYDKFEEKDKRFRIGLESDIEASAVERYAFADAIHEIGKVQHFRSLMEDHLKIGKTENINIRSVAVNMCAGLFDRSGLFQKTKKIYVDKIVDGQKKSSSWTKNYAPAGINLTDIPYDDKIRRDEKAAENGDLKKSVADLQVLDYLFGNIDRSVNDVSYIIQNGKITGVQGLKNYTTFIPDSLIKPLEKSCGLCNLNVIDEELAGKIKLMNPQAIKCIIEGNKLPAETIDAACTRLKNLQQVLSKAKVYKEGDKIINTAKEDPGLEDIKMTIIPSEKWKDISLKELNNCKQSYFNTILGPVKDMCKENEKDYINSLISENNKYRADAALSRASVLTAAHKGNINIRVIGKEMKKATSLFRGSSRQYKDIENNIKKINILTENFMRIPGSAEGDYVDPNSWHGMDHYYSDKAGNYIYYNDKMKSDYLKLLSDTKKMAEEYLESKKGKNNNSYTLKRMDCVKKLSKALTLAEKELSEKIEATEAKDLKVKNLDKYIEGLEKNLDAGKNIENRLLSDMNKSKTAKEKKKTKGEINKNPEKDNPERIKK